MIGGLAGVIDDSRPVTGQLLLLMATGYLSSNSFRLDRYHPLLLGFQMAQTLFALRPDYRKEFDRGKKHVNLQPHSRWIRSTTAYEDDLTLAFLDINPLAPGHTLVIPKEAQATVMDLSEASAAGIGRVLPRITRGKHRDGCSNATSFKTMAAMVRGRK